MGIGEFLKRHSLFAGLLAVLVPLAILLVVQFVWLLRLESMQAIAQAAALDGFLGTVSTKVEYFYRETAERSLNLPASLFTQQRIEKAAYYWKQRPAKGGEAAFSGRPDARGIRELPRLRSGEHDAVHAGGLRRVPGDGPGGEPPSHAEPAEARHGIRGTDGR